MMLLALLFSLVIPTLATGQSTFDLSQEGFHFIKKYEKFYNIPTKVNNIWYVGYGTPCREEDYPDGITKEEAESLLHAELKTSIADVNQFLSKHQIQVTQHQFDALTSFAFGIGTDWMNTAYRFSSYLIAGLNSYDAREVVDSMAVWCHVQGKVDESYLKRRIEEGQLLLYADYGSGSAPKFHYLILNAAEGKVSNNDTVCYEAGTAYGSLPLASRNGYQLEGWYTSSNQKLTAETIVSENLTVTAKWQAASALSFLDVTTSDWFYNDVYALTKSGVLHGVSATKFDPQNDLTRGQALKVILIAAGYGEKAPTTTHWASGYFSFASKEGFIPSSKSNLDEAITRLEIAQIAATALKLSNVNIPSPFEDTSDSAVLALYEIGVWRGYEEGSATVFKPNNHITRAEICAMINRINNLPDKPDSKPSPPPEEPEEETEQIYYAGKWIDVWKNVPVNPYDPNFFYKSNGFTHYRSNAYRYETGVDVSIYQGVIDWKKVKASGIDFAMIRVGGRGWGSAGNIFADQKFKKNIEGALNAGLGVGIYFFSQAITVEEAKEEARYTLDQIKGYNITYPVAFDWEPTGGEETRTYGLDTETLCAASNAFCKMIKDAGYHPMVYFNLHCGYTMFDLSKLMDYDFWYAQYNSAPTFYYGFDMWQYTSSGNVNGIPAKVDLNLYFHKK